MYLERFRLSRPPFSSGDDPAHAYLNGERRGVLATLASALADAEHDIVIVLTAPDGYGKSTLLGRLMLDIDPARLSSQVRGRWTDPAEFLRAVVLGFGFDECSATYQQLRDILQAFLLHQCQRGRVPILLVEDAQNLKPQVLAEVQWLAALQAGDRAALDIVLSGLPELERILRAPAMSVLAARRRQHAEIGSLDPTETRDYILHRLARAESLEADQLFESAAVELVHRYTGGIPGLINTLCETALSCAASAAQPRVTADVVEEAAGKLNRVSDSGSTRVQGMRGTDAKAVKNDELGHLVVTRKSEVLDEFIIRKDRVLIGRKADNDLRLDSRAVSAYHAMLLLDAAGWLLIDLQSTNGTYIGTERIRQRRLVNNDLIRIADLHIRCLHMSVPVSRAAPAAAEATPDVDTTRLPSPLESAPGSPPVPRPRLVKSS